MNEIIAWKRPVHETTRGLAGTLALLTVLCPAPTTAQDAPAPDLEPRVLIQQTTELLVVKVLARRELYREDPAKLNKLVRRTITPRLDMKRASIGVLGRHWRGASREQRKKFSTQFRLLLAQRIADAVLELVDGLVHGMAPQAPGPRHVHDAFSYLPERWSDDGKEVTVSSQVHLSDDSQPIQMEYRMNRRQGSWKIHDISVDGISVIWAYGSSFPSIVRREDMDHLIEYLAGKNQRATGVTN